MPNGGTHPLVQKQNAGGDDEWQCQVRNLGPSREDPYSLLRQAVIIATGRCLSNHPPSPLAGGRHTPNSLFRPPRARSCPSEGEGLFEHAPGGGKVVGVDRFIRPILGLTPSGLGFAECKKAFLAFLSNYRSSALWACGSFEPRRSPLIFYPPRVRGG